MQKDEIGTRYDSKACIVSTANGELDLMDRLIENLVLDPPNWV